MSFQDDEREEETRELFGLEKDETEGSIPPSFKYF